MNLLELSSRPSNVRKCIICLHAKDEHPVVIVHGFRVFDISTGQDVDEFSFEGSQREIRYVTCYEFKTEVQLSLF